MSSASYGITIATADSTAPSFVSIVSAQGSNNAPSVVTITFSEGMQAFFDQTKLTLSSGVTFVAGSGNWTSSTTFTFNVSKPNNGTTYTAAFAAGAFKDIAGNNSGSTSQASLKPAGIAGEPINLGLVAANYGALVTVHISSLPAGMAIEGAVQQADGSWVVETTEVENLAITTPVGFAGAEVLDIMINWTDADGVAHSS